MISTMWTLPFLKQLASMAKALTEFITNLAALGKPKEWSVQAKSLSIVFGTPITLTSSIPNSLTSLANLLHVSMESLPPLMKT